MAMRFMIQKFRWGAARGGGSLHHAPSRIVPQHWSGKEEGIYSVKHASVTGENRPRIFYTRAALDQGFDQVAQLRRDVEDRGKQDHWPELCLFQREQTVF